MCVLVLVHKSSLNWKEVKGEIRAHGLEYKKEDEEVKEEKQ